MVFYIITHACKRLSVFKDTITLYTTHAHSSQKSAHMGITQCNIQGFPAQRPCTIHFLEKSGFYEPPSFCEGGGGIFGSGECTMYADRVQPCNGEVWLNMCQICGYLATSLLSEWLTNEPLSCVGCAHVLWPATKLIYNQLN